MSVRAKFKVDSITTTTTAVSVLLSPVTTGSAENESFFRYTPVGRIELSTINPAAAAQFVPGKSFYVDFTDAGS
jgi:hypothetical protein